MYSVIYYIKYNIYLYIHIYLPAYFFSKNFKLLHFLFFTHFMWYNSWKKLEDDVIYILWRLTFLLFFFLPHGGLPSDSFYFYFLTKLWNSMYCVYLRHTCIPLSSMWTALAWSMQNLFHIYFKIYFRICLLF